MGLSVDPFFHFCLFVFSSVYVYIEVILLLCLLQSFFLFPILCCEKITKHVKGAHFLLLN